MSPSRRRTATGPRPRGDQPALALGHHDVCWDALPAAVRDDVLAQWSELLSSVAAVNRLAAPVDTAAVALPETRS